MKNAYRSCCCFKTFQLIYYKQKDSICIVKVIETLKSVFPRLDHNCLSAKSFQAQHCVYCKLAEEGYKTNTGENVGELKLKIEIFIPLRGGNKNQPNIIGRFIGKDGQNVSRNIIIYGSSLIFKQQSTFSVFT